MKRKLSKGAEAIIYSTKNNIIKDRIKKNYRINEIDSRLRKFRTKRESKILERLNDLNFPAPKLIKTDKKQIIEMQYLKGKKLRDVLDDNTIKLAKELGKKIAILHNNNIIHGDLTTSNMILKDQIYFIDFGLSFISHKTEHKAVDLHLLKQALDSKHYKVADKAFKAAITAYNKESNDKDVLERLNKVEERGRYKLKQRRVRNS